MRYSASATMPLLKEPMSVTANVRERICENGLHEPYFRLHAMYTNRRDCTNDRLQLDGT